jgi:lysozyme
VRLYHPGVLQHHWTTDWYEVTVLAAGAWSYEGIPGYVIPTPVGGTIPLYRLALAQPPLHLWTTDENEKNVLSTERGWIYEGIIGNVI